MFRDRNGTDIGIAPSLTTETLFEFVIRRRLFGFKKSTRFKGKWSLRVIVWGNENILSGVVYGSSVEDTRQQLEHERDEAFRLSGAETSKFKTS